MSKKYSIIYVLLVILLMSLNACNNTEKMIEKGEQYLKVEEWEKASQIFVQVLDKEPTNIRARYDYAKALEGLGEKEKAISEYKKVLKLNPDIRIMTEIKIRLAKYEMSKDNLREALNYLEGINNAKIKDIKAKILIKLSEKDVNNSIQYIAEAFLICPKCEEVKNTIKNCNTQEVTDAIAQLINKEEDIGREQIYALIENNLFNNKNLQVEIAEKLANWGDCETLEKVISNFYDYYKDFFTGGCLINSGNFEEGIELIIPLQLNEEVQEDVKNFISSILKNIHKKYKIKILKVGASVANVRTKPSIKSKKLTTLKTGDEVGIILDVNNWYLVETPDKKLGYIYKTLLTDKDIYLEIKRTGWDSARADDWSIFYSPVIYYSIRNIGKKPLTNISLKAIFYEGKEVLDETYDVLISQFSDEPLRPGYSKSSWLKSSKGYKGPAIMLGLFPAVKAEIYLDTGDGYKLIREVWIKKDFY